MNSNTMRHRIATRTAQCADFVLSRLNTKRPSVAAEDGTLPEIHLRNVPPPFETFDHVSLLRLFASWIRPARYLELGVRGGDSFTSIAPFCAEAHGVDVSDVLFKVRANMFIHKQTTDEYFASLDKGLCFDMVFIDADHSFEQSRKDFMNAAEHVIVDGFIFLHDTYPCRPDLFAPHLCNDAYKVPLWIKQNMLEDFEVVTLPFNPGLTIVKKMRRDVQLNYHV